MQQPSIDHYVRRSGPVAASAAFVLSWSLAALGVSARRRLAFALGHAAYALGVRRKVVLDNLRGAFPDRSETERRAIARGAYQHMALAALEAIAASLAPPERLPRVVEDGGFERLRAAVAGGRGVLCATGHLGNWEIFGAHVQRNIGPLSVIVRRLKGEVNARIVRARMNTGARIILPKGAVKEALASLAEGRLIMALIDQAMPREHGVFAPFFGRPASTTPLLSLCAARAGLPVFVFGSRREGDVLHGFVDGPFEVPVGKDGTPDLVAHTAILTAALERHIREAPEQWLWHHRRWKVQPEQAP